MGGSILMDFGINALHRLHGLNDDGGCWEAMSGRRSVPMRGSCTIGISASMPQRR